MSTAAAAAGSAPSPLSTAPASPLSPPVRTNAALDAGDVAKRMLSFDLNAGATVPGSPVPSEGTREPFLIGVCGGTASGKTTVCDRIMHQLQERRVVLISQDSFYRGLTPEESANVKDYNFDHPNAMDQAAIVQCLCDLKNRLPVEVPIYDFKTHSRAAKTQTVYPADIIIFEGILVLAMDEVRALLNMKIFVDTDDDVRLARRIKRDTCDRGRDVHGVLEQYTRFVKPMFDLYVSPSKKYGDVIIPWAGGENGVAIDLIVQHIRTKLMMNDQRRHYPNLKMVPSNYQIRGMHTIIRDVNTSRNDFVFYADRLIRLVVEHGLGCLPFSEVTVQTPTGADYNGVAFSNRLCGVSVIRSGESMENALRACCKGVKIGKILIRRERDMGPCRIMYEKLPLDISRRYVLLLDPILASGASSVAAIDLLLSKGVAEERIIFLTLIAAPPGIKAICESYPKLTVVTTEIDNSLSPTHVVLPGIGEFGDRYFGTDSISCDRPGEVSYASTTPCDSAAASAARARLLAREALNREAMELAAQNGTNTPEANANGARTSTTGDLVGR